MREMLLKTIPFGATYTTRVSNTARNRNYILNFISNIEDPSGVTGQLTMWQMLLTILNTKKEKQI